MRLNDSHLNDLRSLIDGGESAYSDEQLQTAGIAIIRLAVIKMNFKNGTKD